MKKMRADEFMVALGLTESRSKAQAAIMAGEVFSRPKSSESEDSWEPVKKASQSFPEGTQLQLRSLSAQDVGRGAQKLRGALERWTEIDVFGKECLDIGASTGGFTQVLLERGAARVIALDVGTHQLHERLRRESRVVSIEQQHVLKVDDAFWKTRGLSADFDLIVTDLSFISLERVLPHAAPWLKKGAHWLLLVKPQFELDRTKLVKGIVKNPEFQKEAVDRVVMLASEPSLGLSYQDLMESPILGGDGNKEFLLWLKKA